MWRQLAQQLLAMWGRLGTGMRMLFGVVLVGTVLTIGWVAFRPQTYVPLYSNLSVEELGAVKAKLDASATTYKLDGSMILVPSDQYEKLRVEMAVSGLPIANGKGFELFDETQIGMSPYVQNINHTRATQGELERTIKMISSVKQVRVHIVQPDSTPFVREQKPVTASVLLTTKSNAQLTQPQVDGIVSLVATGVKGLNRENVTIVDALTSRVLTKRSDDPDSAVSNDQLTHQREIERHLAEKAQEMLDRVFGYGKAVVRVTADMRFQHLKEATETYTPEGRALVEERVTNSKTTGAERPTGVAGAAANLAPVQPASFSSSQGNSTDETIDSKWLVSKTNRHSEQKLGQIDRLTVAVMLVQAKPVEGSTEQVALAISREEAEKLVKQAVGFKETRDSIQVTVGTPPDDASDPGATLVPWYEMVRSAGVGVASMLVAFSVLVAVWLHFRNQARRLQYEAAQRNAIASEDIRHLETVAEALRQWVDS